VRLLINGSRNAPGSLPEDSASLPTAPGFDIVPTAGREDAFSKWVVAASKLKSPSMWACQI